MQETGLTKVAKHKIYWNTKSITLMTVYLLFPYNMKREYNCKTSKQRYNFAEWNKFS